MKMTPKLVCAVLLILAYYVVSGNCDCFTQSGSEWSEPISSDLFHVTKFSINLFKNLIANDPEENLFLSPYSVWNALALAYLGSEGKTKKELQDVLGIHDKISTLKTWRSLNYLYKIRQMSSSGYFFGLANKIFLDNSLLVRRCVKLILENELQMINFNETSNSVSIINDYVKLITDDHVPSVINVDDLKNVNSVIVNAAFFSDKWLKPFKKQQTKQSTFYPFEGQPQKMAMMINKGFFNHGVSETLQCHILELPYTLSDISMFVFLPPSTERKESFEVLLKNLNSDTFLDAVESLSVDELDISIPKLTVSQTFDHQLKKALQDSGVHQLFDPRGSNLTTFVPDQEVILSKLVHSASLKLSEEGTVASSGTPAALESGRFARPQHLKNFNCDHPFIYTIYDKLTRNILFMGAYKG